MHKGIDLRKKGKKKSPQRGTYKYDYNHVCTRYIISTDSRNDNFVNNDLLVVLAKMLRAGEITKTELESVWGKASERSPLPPFPYTSPFLR